MSKNRDFVIFKYLPGIKGYEEEYEFLRNKKGKLVLGVFCDIQSASKTCIDEEEGEYDVYAMGESIPDWLSELIRKTCPEYDIGCEEPEYIIPETDLEDLEKLASEVYLVDGPGHLYNPDEGRKKIWVDVTKIYKLGEEDYRDSPDREKLEEARLEAKKKAFDWIKQLYLDYDCKITLYKEPSTENRYLCIDAEDSEDSQLKSKGVDVSGKKLEKVQLKDTFFYYGLEEELEKKVVGARREYDKYLGLLDEYHF